MARSVFAPPDPDALLTPQNVADRFGVTTFAVYKWVRSGRLPCIRVSRKTVRFTEEQIEHYLKTHTIGRR
jgi:excisionase family DNA binding protein